MKRPSLHSRSSQSSGFTLIELLVVIGIIAILAGVLFPAGTAAIRAAQRAKANTIATNIQTSVLAYNTEYSVYPVPSGTTADVSYNDTDGSDWALLTEALCGNISPTTGASVPATTITNTRGIAFLNLKSSDVFNGTGGTKDAPKNPLPSSATANIYFNIAMDSDYSGVIGDATSGVTLPNFATSTIGNISTSPSGTTTAGVAVWANCNGNNVTTSWNPNFFVKTY